MGATKLFVLGVLNSGPPAMGATKAIALGVFKYQTESKKKIYIYIYI